MFATAPLMFAVYSIEFISLESSWDNVKALANQAKKDGFEDKIVHHQD